MLYSYKTIISQYHVYSHSTFRVPFGQKFTLKCFARQQFCSKDVLRTTEAQRFRQEPNNLIWITYIGTVFREVVRECDAHLSFMHNCVPSVESGKAYGPGSPSVLGRRTMAAVNGPISGGRVVPLSYKCHKYLC